jgi:hypothetical protein
MLQSQQILAAGMLRPAHLLDLIRNFTVFQQVDGKTRKIVARYQQFRAIHKAVDKLLEGRTKSKGAERDERGGIVWHTQGSGKSLSMVFLVRKMRMMPRLNRFKVVVVTDRTDLQKQLGETAQLSGEAVRPTDSDLQSRESPTALTQRLLAERTPDIVMAMLQKYQPVSSRAGGNRLEVLPQPGAKVGDRVAMTILRKEKKPGRHEEVVEKEITFTENIRFEEFPQLNDSEEILVLVDEAHRSHTPYGFGRLIRVRAHRRDPRGKRHHHSADNECARSSRAVVSWSARRAAYSSRSGSLITAGSRSSSASSSSSSSSSLISSLGSRGGVVPTRAHDTGTAAKRLALCASIAGPLMDVAVRSRSHLRSRRRSSSRGY